MRWKGLVKQISEKSMLILIAAFAAIYVLWGSTYLAIKFAIETLPAFTMAGALRGEWNGFDLAAVSAPRGWGWFICMSSVRRSVSPPIAGC
jgi:hypothetical protein